MNNNDNIILNPTLASYLYEPSIFRGQLTILLTNPTNKPVTGTINVILPNLIVPEFYKQFIKLNDSIISSNDYVFKAYEFKSKKSTLYTIDITLKPYSSYIWVIPYQKVFFLLK